MKIGIIGGSGLEKGDVLRDVEEVAVETPYGMPSSVVKKGKLGDVEVYIISRHGLDHEITPSKVNNRANVLALKQLGCEFVLATTAVGSLRNNIQPGDFVIANQFIDFTKHRISTFYDDFLDGVKHTSMAEPFSDLLRSYLIESCFELGLNHHKIGTILTIEGPRFSTRAESFMFQKFAHVVNMSTAPEAVLAKEAGLEYAVVAMATDYDCWKKNEIPVSWEEIERVMNLNSENVKKILIKVIEKISSQDVSRKDIEFIRSSIRTIPHFPKTGIMFRDITTLLKNKEAMNKVVEVFVNRYRDEKIDVVCGIESRGFIFGAILAEKLGASFVPVRKPGKLPFETLRQDYKLEYGTDAVEIHKDAIVPGSNVLIVDDLLATGGTARATCDLIEKLGGKIIECAFVIELTDLNGREKLGREMFSVVGFGGE
ncbi:S-methyl-5'-thioadenosine phosphorylase [Nanoarchaeota archaeon]